VSSANRHWDLDEVEAAIAGLSDEEKVNLRDAAKATVWNYRLDRAEHGPEDLLTEATSRTLEGRRRWRRSVPLMAHLIMTMKSIASQRRRQAVTRVAAGFRVLRQSEYRHRLEDDGEFFDLLARAPSPEPDPERTLIAKEEVRPFLRHFVGDRAAILVMTGWKWGMTGPQIQACHNLTPEEFAAAVKRIRRYAKRLSRSRSEG
jgi:hypothetical protein